MLVTNGEHSNSLGKYNFVLHVVSLQSLCGDGKTQDWAVIFKENGILWQ